MITNIFTAYNDYPSKKNFLDVSRDYTFFSSDNSKFKYILCSNILLVCLGDINIMKITKFSLL